MKKLTICLALLTFSIIFSSCAKSDETSDKTIIEPQTDIAGVWTKGNSDATLILTEYSDFQCPACAAYAPVIDELVTEMGDDFLFEYHHFPLRSVHRNTDIASQASEAAGIQGKFWEMHAKLFANQNEWSHMKKPEEEFQKYAEEIGLDTDRFMNDIYSKAVKKKVDADYEKAGELKLTGTPSFFINGKPIKSPRSFEEFSSMMKSLANSGV